MNEISAGKVKVLDSLLTAYKQEVETIYAVAAAWNQLKDEAKAACVEDFDKAIEDREDLLEELAGLRDAGIVPDKYEFTLFTVDQFLLEQRLIVKAIYGLDVNSYLNVKKPKGLLKAKK